MTSATVEWITLGVRGATIAALMLLLVVGVRDDGSGAANVRVSGDTPAALLATEVGSMTSSRLTYADTVPPTRAVSTLLSAAARSGRGVTLMLPSAVPPLSVRAPRAPVAQRRAALSITVRGDPGAERQLILEGEAGQSDSLVVIVGPTGTGTVAVGVEAARAGLATWAVRNSDGANEGAATVHASAWVRPPTPLRVLVLTASPDWESRYIIRALEAVGAQVAVRQALGNAQVVASSGAPEPTTLADLEPFDVVVFGGAEAGEELLRQWAIERGGGVLLLRAGQESRQSSEAAAITWSAPAEWLPLPGLAIDISSRGIPVATDRERSQGVLNRSSAVATLAGTEQVVMTAGSLGRGRLVVSGLETWPWVMEGGAVGPHSDFWHSVLEWLAGGLRSDVVLEASPGQPFALWEGRLEGTAGPLAVVSGPDGSSATLSTVSTIEERSRIRFVPNAGGAYPIATVVGDTVGAAIVQPGEERLDWSTAALEVGGSGGALRTDPQAAEAHQPTPLGAKSHRDWLAFLLLCGLGAGAWAMRRTNGLM